MIGHIACQSNSLWRVNWVQLYNLIGREKDIDTDNNDLENGESVSKYAPKMYILDVNVIWFWRI